ncbi:radical SAM protein [Paraburkholderia oxyphila]|uniref:radical SAM protein n=1 Tax=Paraburkholderia oxyphila TaxID=614212 RepID=UPI000A07BAB4|nr:radical SAM protein [Paraburkholderia oxyphila]
MALLQIVIKVSKLCNLRCRYCYEFEQLTNSERMGQANIHRLFLNLRAAVEREKAIKRVEIIWHGGEPTLLPATYFQEAIASQRSVFSDSRILVTHSVQTNLFRLTPKILDLLTGPLFQKVGVSMDVSGGLRVDIRDRDSTARVVQNIDLLKSTRPGIGGIAVLSRDNMNDLPAIMQFYEDRGMPCRISPVYRSAYVGQNSNRAMSREQLVSAYCWLIQRWTVTKRALRCEPANHLLATALRVIARRKLRYDSLQIRDRLLIIDTDGRVYYQADAYDSALSHGNYFEDPNSNREGKRISNSRAADRMHRLCSQCEFFGPCDGFAVVEATEDERALGTSFGGTRCPVVYPVIRFTVDLLQQRTLDNRAPV